MAEITFIQHDGTKRRLNVRSGLTLMEGAVWSRVPGILGVCCGDGGCATCHVYVDEAWTADVGTPSNRERSTLRFALDVDVRSRLACQIRVTDALNGLVVHVPQRQY